MYSQGMEIVAEEEKRIKRVLFQGMRGAYSEQACREMLSGGIFEFEPAKTFEDLFDGIAEGRADLGMIPVENSMAGVVSDSYDLMAVHHLHIVGEYYLHVRHALLGVRESSLAHIHNVSSHPQALAQCRNFIRSRGWNQRSVYDTAGAAAELAEANSPEGAAIASELCSELYDLKILERDVQDSDLNTTRFVVISREFQTPPESSDMCKTSLLFEVRNIPAALYKCLGGFATNGINLTRLESRPVQGRHWAYHFYLDFEGHVEEKRAQQTLEELSFFTTNLKILGCYLKADRPM